MLKRVAREMGRQLELVDCLVEGAFGLNPEQFKARMLESARGIAGQADVILFRAGFHGILRGVHCTAHRQDCAVQPAFLGALALRRVLEMKGLM